MKKDNSNKQIEENFQKFEKKEKIKLITLYSILSALCIVSTSLIKFPVLNGYIHVGDTFLILMTIINSSTMGVFFGAISSTLSDFLAGYPIYAVATFFIKLPALFIIYIIFRLPLKIKTKFIVSGLIYSTIISLMYYLYGYFIFSNKISPLINISTDFLQGSISTILAYYLYKLKNKM